VFLDDTVQKEFLSVVCVEIQVIRGEPDLSRLRVVVSFWAQQLTQRCLYLIRKALEATAAYEPQCRADLPLDEHILSPLPDEQMPGRLHLHGEVPQSLPSAVLASNIEAQTILRNVRTRYLHDL
jgi:hypothetical protein